MKMLQYIMLLIVISVIVFNVHFCRATEIFDARIYINYYGEDYENGILCISTLSESTEFIPFSGYLIDGQCDGCNVLCALADHDDGHITIYGIDSSNSLFQLREFDVDSVVSVLAVYNDVVYFISDYPHYNVVRFDYKNGQSMIYNIDENIVREWASHPNDNGKNTNYQPERKYYSILENGQIIHYDWSSDTVVLSTINCNCEIGQGQFPTWVNEVEVLYWVNHTLVKKGIYSGKEECLFDFYDVETPKLYYSEDLISSNQLGYGDVLTILNYEVGFFSSGKYVLYLLNTAESSYCKLITAIDISRCRYDLTIRIVGAQ